MIRAVRREGGKAGRRASAVAILLGALTAVPPYRLTAAQEPARGKIVYDKWCAGCHGDDGAGDGPAAAFMLPRPRDFTGAIYQIRSTASGALPTDGDLRRVIDEGMPGTAMPGWKAKLGPGERDDVIAYIKTFSQFFEGAGPDPVEMGGAPRANAQGIEEGRRIYDDLECFKCHGDAGRGDGGSAPTLTDDWDFPIWAADLSEPWLFNGGARVEDIYRRLRTGLDGTPMPSFADVVEAEIITDEQLWRLAQYLRSLGPDRVPPPVREVIRAVRVEAGEFPAGPEDSLWHAAPRSYIPLVGQIIVAPRWFAPRVDGLWVQAMHDGERLAMRFEWHDPSRSPDPAWQEWLDRMAATMTDVDGPIPTTQGPDRLTVQFPRRAPEGMERPYFLGGDARRPVYWWRWTSEPDRLNEGTATGLGTFTPQSGSGARHTAQFDRGAWMLQVTRPLVPPDTTAAPTFRPGEPVPVAFFASDGSNGEDAVRTAVSSWYAVYLDVPTPVSVYLLPVAAAVVTAGLGVVVIARAQRRERDGTVDT